MTFGEKFKEQGALTLVFFILSGYFLLTHVFPGVLSTICCCNSKNKVGESSKSIKEEGTFNEIKESLKFKGQAAYDMRDNPKYRSIILLLDRR